MGQLVPDQHRDSWLGMPAWLGGITPTSTTNSGKFYLTLSHQEGFNISGSSPVRVKTINIPARGTFRFNSNRASAGAKHQKRLSAIRSRERILSVLR